MARPHKYNKSIFDKLCAEISEGKSLRSICTHEEMPHKRTFYRWIRENPELCAQYKNAKEDRADTYADQMVDLADSLFSDELGLLTSEKIQAIKVMIEARKWVACKLHPRNYGDKQEQNVNVALSYTEFLKELPNPDMKTVSSS